MNDSGKQSELPPPPPPDENLPPISPDYVEEDLGEELDNIVPTRGYQMTPMVGLGGSAGCLPPLRAFFQAMPPDSGMIFVVIVHLSPEHESILPDLISRDTSMAVCQAADSQKVVPNTVYVIPPGKFLTTVNGHLKLADLSRDKGRRVAVDLFFRSLADTHGLHAAAIVLSGADGDGAVGLRRIKERGGLTIAQDPDEAEHSGMPRAAIATGTVDWVLRANEMPARVLEYIRLERNLKLPPEEGVNPAIAPRPTPTDQEMVFRELVAFLRMRTGRDFSYYKRATILRRIARRMQVNAVTDLAGYLLFLRTHPGEAGALLKDLLISVTNFFRDRDCFAELERRIPSLFEGKTQADSVRVWVPACATGEEAYSIIMLLLEHARKIDSAPAIQVFGCDLDEEAIQTARAGCYPEAIAADVSPERLRRFFVKDGPTYRVRREVREVVLFAAHDLLKDAPFSRMDLISCRNLLIYLDREAQNRVLQTFHFAFKPRGLLFLGSSESVEDGSPLFRVLDKKYRLYEHTPAARTDLPVPHGPGTLVRQLQQQAQREGPTPVLPGRGFTTGASIPIPSGRGLAIREDERQASLEVHYKLIERFSPPSVIINADHEILHLSENAGRFLQVAGGQPTANLLRLVHPMLRVELRGLLFRAAQSGEMAEAFRVPFDMEGARKVVDIRVFPAADVAPDCMLVVFEARESVPGEPPHAQHHLDAEPAIQHVERELEQIKSHLRDTVEQYEASTEELKASNEELQAMNEELRSATEELETSREELQSINEELSTVNSELKAKVDELGQANSDLQNLMASTNIATIFLDRDLCIKRFTPSAVGIFHLIASDIGRPLSDLQHRLDYHQLRADAENVIQTLVPVERELTAEGDRSFLARVLPYRTIDDHIGGIVLTFVDITERKRAEEALRDVLKQSQEAWSAADAASKARDRFLAILSHELRTPLMPVLTAADSLLEQGGLPSAATDALKMIIKNVELEAKLIDDLLDLTRITRGRFELDRKTIDVHDPLRSAVEVVQPDFDSKNQQVTHELRAASAEIEGDPVKLQQAFWNLLKNASKFTTERGWIRVTSENPTNEKIRIAVADNGMGIDPEALPSIFESFRQANASVSTSYGGLGLGLAITKGIVEAHGGTLSASSEGKGKGATFFIDLPLRNKAKN